MRSKLKSHSNPPGYPVKPVPGRAAILVSGGLDSCVLLDEMTRRYRRIFPLYVRAGLRWEAQELNALKRFLNAIASHRIEPLTVLALPMTDIAGNHWSVKGDHLPGYRASVSSNYILGRNLILLSKAAVFCAAKRISAVAMAPLEANPFPDARPEFFQAFARAVELGTGLKLKVLTPYTGLDKAAMVRRGRHLPLNLTVSCIRPRALVHCGACTKCAERREGYRAAGIADPTRYAKVNRAGAPNCR